MGNDCRRDTAKFKDIMSNHIKNDQSENNPNNYSFGNIIQNKKCCPHTHEAYTRKKCKTKSERKGGSYSNRDEKDLAICKYYTKQQNKIKIEKFFGDFFEEKFKSENNNNKNNSSFEKSMQYDYDFSCRSSFKTKSRNYNNNSRSDSFFPGSNFEDGRHFKHSFDFDSNKNIPNEIIYCPLEKQVEKKSVTPSPECSSYRNKNNNLKKTGISKKTLNSSNTSNTDYSSKISHTININLLPSIKKEISISEQNRIRKEYYSKLVVNNMYPIVPRQTCIEVNKIFIFDWDDTLFCTSYLAPNGIFKEKGQLSDKDNMNIAELQKLAVEILSFCINKGDTFIITNAAQGWVQHSVSIFYPQLKELLQKVVIISARKEFEKKFPGQCRKWKLHTFLRLTECFCSKVLTNLICFGDSNYEIEACHLLSSKFENIYVKSVKFRENPKPEELIKELRLVRKELENIYKKLMSLTVNVEKKTKNKI